MTPHFSISLSILAFWAGFCGGAGAVPLSDGSFRGWEGDTQTTWRVEDGAFTAGRVEVMQPRNEFLRSTREYGDFELTLKWKLIGTEGFVNGGVQFRTQAIPGNHEVSGYQADLGAGFDGALYDESRRNTMLAQPTAAVLEKARKPLGEWNEYRIRAEGSRIRLWLNGVLTVDYTEADPAIPQKGIIAVQIHGGAKSQVWYKDLEMVELGSGGKRLAPAGPVQQRFADVVPDLAKEAFVGGTFAMRPGEVIAFLGGTNVVQEGRTGWLETALTVGAAAGSGPRFRNLAWEGDTVYEQWRDLNFGSWKEQLEAMGATCVVLGFGQMESMDANRGPEEFRAAYAQLLAELRAVTPRVVLLAPLPLEPGAAPAGSAVAGAAARLPQWTEVVRQLAADQGLPFVAIEPPVMSGGKSWTSNGIHATAAGWAELSRQLGESLMGRPGISLEGHEATRQAIVRKNREWFDCWRATNWAFAYSDRTEQPFGQAAGGHPALAQELEQYKPRLRLADQAIRDVVAQGGGAAVVPPLAEEEPAGAAQPVQSPEEERQSFQVRPGFAVNLFASEADGLVKPLAMRWDERGRLWAACSPSYPQLIPGQAPGDYLLVCEDTDGDGKADRFHKYAEHLTMPMGIEFGKGGVYVCESTELAFLADKDGDGVADERRVILSGFGTGDSHQMINSLRWGPDGCLWFSQGLHIFSRIETPHGLVRFDRAGLWRFDPRSWKLQGFFGNAAAGANCWGVTFDDWGQVFHCAADNTPGFYTTPGLGTWPTPPRYDGIGSLAVSPVKGMSLEYLQGSHLPPELQGALCKPVYFSNSVLLYRLVEDGSGFKTEELGPLLTSSNGAFRPLGVQAGPDGALYVCDWYNPVIGHYQASYRDPNRDRVHGRIWRVAATDRALAARPALERMDAGELLEQLGSRERWVRDRARRLLADGAAGPGEREVAGEASPERLFEWLALQCSQGRMGEALLRRCLSHPEGRLRAFAVRVWGQHWQDRGLVGAAAEEEALGQLAAAVQDPHPRVRLEAVIAAGYLPGERILEVACRVLDHPRDRFIDYALANTVKALQGVWRPALEAGRLTFGGQAGHLAFVLQSDGGEGLGPVVRALLAGGRLEGEARTALRGLLIRGGSVEDVAAAVEAGPVGPEIVAAVSARAADLPGLAVPAAWLQAIPAWLQSAQISEQAAALQLIRAFRLVDFVEAVRGKVGAGEAGAVETLAALAGSAAIPELVALASGRGEPPLLMAALRALAPLDLPGAAGQGAALAARGKRELLGELQGIFLERAGGAAAWEEALAKVALPREAAAALLEALAKAGRREPGLDAVLRPAAGLVEPHSLPPYSAAYVSQLVAQAQAQGDGKRGGEVFRMALSACLGCHRVGEEGGVTGPNLTAAGRGMTPELIAESVLWPQRQIKEGYFLSTVTLRDGRMITGYKVSEDEAALGLREPGAEVVQSLRRSEIAERHESGSLMPEGLTAWMSPGQRLDLLKYLFTLGK